MTRTPAAFLIPLSIAAIAVGQTRLDNAARQRGYDIRSALEKGDTNAADALLTISEAEPEMTVYFLHFWTQPLMKMKRYDVVYALADVVTKQRPYAWPEAADAQRLRTLALLDEGKFDQAVVEAKRNFDLCLLARTDDAVGLLALAMRGKNPGSEDAIRILVAEQSSGVPTARSISTDLAPAGPATRPGVLSAIEVDAKPFADALAGTFGNDDFGNWSGRGNLLLLSGKPGEAKGYFRKIAEAEGMNQQQLTRAIEGIARCIRAEDGNPARANAFVAEVQGKP